jgi:translocator protein
MPSTASPLLPPFAPRSLIFLGIAVFIVAAASFLGSSATTPSLPVWYAGLNKPWFNPPNWLFPIAWSTLFALMAFGFWRILRQVESGAARNAAIFAFLLQILVNITWSFAFFGAQSTGAGLVVAVMLVVAVARMIFAFRALDELAAWLQLPYLCWVTFALVLNAAIWRLN